MPAVLAGTLRAAASDVGGGSCCHLRLYKGGLWLITDSIQST